MRIEKSLHSDMAKSKEKPFTINNCCRDLLTPNIHTYINFRK